MGQVTSIHLVWAQVGVHGSPQIAAPRESASTEAVESAPRPKTRTPSEAPLAKTEVVNPCRVSGKNRDNEPGGEPEKKTAKEPLVESLQKSR